MTHVAAVIEQETFRFGSDGTESGYSFIATESTDITVGDETGTDIDFATIIILRIRMAETAGATNPEANQTVELQYSLAGGAFTNVTGSSTVVQAIASAMTDAEDTTERLVGGSGTFLTTNAGVDEADGVAGGANLDLPGNNYTELAFAIQVIKDDVTDGQTIDFRITRVSGTLMDNEATADEPRITIDEVAGSVERTKDTSLDSLLTKQAIEKTVSLDAYLTKQGLTLSTGLDAVLLSAEFVPTFAAFRLYEDGTESGSSPIEAQDTDTTGRDVNSDSQVQLRVRIDETGSGDGATSDDWRLEYRLNGGGSWIIITGASAAIQSDPGSSLSDGSLTTDRSTNGISAGPGSFVAGEQEHGDGQLLDRQLTADNHTEHVWGILLISSALSNNDALTFRVTLNGSNITAGVVPSITVSKTAAGVAFPPYKPLMMHLLSR